MHSLGICVRWCEAGESYAIGPINIKVVRHLQMRFFITSTEQRTSTNRFAKVASEAYISPVLVRIAMFEGDFAEIGIVVRVRRQCRFRVGQTMRPIVVG